MALSRLGVDAEIKEKEEVFAYMLKKVALRDDKMVDFLKKPISYQSLQVNDLCLILNEDMPEAGDLYSLQEKTLQLVALALTELKVPVLDGLQKFEDQEIPGVIDTNTFAVNVLENEFGLKQRLTRNMIKCLVSRYETADATTFRYSLFLTDLKNCENVSPASIRIFKTQNEINFFNQTQGQTGDNEMDIEAESYRQNRVLVEPTKEPVYDSVTAKNTYYQPSADDTYGNYSNQHIHTSFMDQTGDHSFGGAGAGPGPLKPLLDLSLVSYVNDVVVLTRRLGVSVEGYFQRFGKFSTQDGIRKIDLKQFTDAVRNLSESNWANEKP